MHELKFRAWDGHRMQTEFTLDAEDGMVRLLGYSIHGAPTDPAPWFKVMQYTGLKDKNGVEIYEGDILQTGSNEVWLKDYHPEINPSQEMQEIQRGIVSYVGASFVLLIKDYKDGYPLSTLMMHKNRGGLLVIGNIYENPELLGE